MRVRASAGAGSFRRKETLEGYREAARAEVARRDGRAAHERQARLEKALARVPELSPLCWMRPILA